MSPTLAVLRSALACAICAAGPAFAAGGTIAGVTFQVDITIDDGAGGTEAVGPFSAAANAIDDNYYSAADLQQYFTLVSNNIDYDVRINWVDANSVDVFFTGFGSGDLSQLKITLSDLAFKDGAAPTPIVGATFNRPASNLHTFNAGSSLADPAVSFTDTSMSITYGYFQVALLADGPRLRFDLQTAAVPEPASIALMLGGLGLLALTRRRRQPRDLASAAMRS